MRTQNLKKTFFCICAKIPPPPHAVKRLHVHKKWHLQHNFLHVQEYFHARFVASEQSVYFCSIESRRE